MENFIYQKILEGYSKKELYEQLKKNYGYNAKYKSFGKRFLRAKRKLDSGENPFINKYSSLINYLKKNKHSTVIELREGLNCSYKEVYDLIRFARTKGYEITTNDENVILSKDRVLEPLKKIEQLGTTEIVFGIASDLHFGSNCCQITNLHEFANICSKEGVKHIFVPGDVVAGTSVFPGQMHEIYAYTAAEQENSVIRNLPKGQFKWYMIGGNHDYNFVKRSGHNPLRVIESKRDDVVYCGFDIATIPILNNVDLMMWHPSGGLPYSLCLSEDTDILTKRGWVGHDSISMSDEIATLNPETHMLEYQKPEELFIENYEGKMIHIESRTVDHLVTPEHDIWTRLYHEGKDDKPWGKISAGKLTKEFKRQNWQLDMTAEWEGEEKETFSIPFRKWSGARDLGEINMDSFLKFLGWYISEGHINNEKSICVSQVDELNTNNIVSCMEEIGLNVKIYQDNYSRKSVINRIRGYNASLVRWLNEHAGSNAHNKKVPRFIMDLSPRQIEIFLDALFAEGGIKKKGIRWYQYYSVSKQLKDDIQELLLKVGTAATIHKNNNVSVLQQNRPTINEEPKVVDYNGKIWCVRVPNGLIYARRNGKPVWTGNSYRLQKGAEQYAIGELQKVALGKKDKPSLRFFLAGHLHVQLEVLIGNILALQCGCFEGQTNYIKRKGYTVSVGGYIVKASLGHNGNLKNFNTKFYLYDEIENDWKSYSHEPLEEIIINGKLDKPLFVV
ncbi:MAG: LAGLIDADG family homing endonuclease [Atribacterota bacterium]